MTVILVRQAIRAFLQTPTPQVLCIRGKWGVGKTYIWNEVLKQTKAEGGISLPYYSYVSLFGLQTIDEVRQVVFENTVQTNEVEMRPSLESFGQNIKRYTIAAGRQVSKFAPYAKLPYLDKYVTNFAGGFRQIVSLTVRETIICFDDFERKKIDAKDFLGLVSQFREQRDCKAVIILNEDALSTQEKAEFGRYFEKVVDIPIEFSPTPEECATVAIKAVDFVGQRIKDDVVKLGISNIRIIFRITSIAETLMKIIDIFNDDIKKQALQTLTLVVWSKYSDDAIPMENILDRNGRMRRLMGDDDRSDDDKKWDKMLQEYGFGECDDLDMAIKTGVERGFFDETEIVNQAQKQHSRQEAASAQEALHQAWQAFHNSFDNNNLPDIINGIYNAYKMNMKYISRGDLDDALRIFRALGFGARASELISGYIDCHRAKISQINESASPFDTAVKDDEFRKELDAVAVSPAPKPLNKILIDLYRGKMSRQDIDVACALSADALYALFCGLQGDELYQVVAGSLFFRQVLNATDAQKMLTKNALEALEKIGRQSVANAIRVKKFGVEVGDATPADDGPNVGQNS